MTEAYRAGSRRAARGHMTRAVMIWWLRDILEELRIVAAHASLDQRELFEIGQAMDHITEVTRTGQR